jgi:hypothetical protein
MSSPTSSKPKLVFFQQQCDPHLPDFLLLHKRDHVKCLSHFFNVRVITEACDYQEICNKYEPELTLFESGAAFASSQRLQVTSTQACPQVPKVGFLHSDPFCKSRAAFLSDMDHWGINTFFTIATTAAEHTPAIANNLFTWPNFVDTNVYRDYGQWKSIPVLFTGASFALYPWRQKISRLVAAQYPSLICPHPGHVPLRGTTQTLSGERYARTINASWVVPACGSVAKEVLRKHFEIPACRACLITEMSSGLQAAGFADMQNCVVVDEHNVLDKLAYLFNNPDKLTNISNAGYELVRARHTLKHRDQLLQWLKLHEQLRSDEQIVQVNPFEPLRIVRRSTRSGNSHLAAGGVHLVLLREGDAKLWNGDYDRAETAYLKCANYIPWMPEPQLRLALCNLYKGKPQAALHWILKPINFTIGEYKALDPDPIEWACFILTLICLGRLNDASERSNQFLWLHHPELDRVRWMTALLGRGASVGLPRSDDTQTRRSVHQLPELSLQEWTQRSAIVLRACGQTSFAQTLSRYSRRAIALSEPHIIQDTSDQPSSDVGASVQLGLAKPRDDFFKGRKHSNISEAQIRYGRLRLVAAGKAKTKQLLGHILHSLEAKYGYFLPYHLSESRNDEFFHAIQGLTRNHSAKAALILGADSGQYACDALLAGARESKYQPFVFCITSLKRRSSIVQQRFSKDRVHWYTPPSSTYDWPQALDNAIATARRENQCDRFDIVLIHGSKLPGSALRASLLRQYLLQATLVFLDDINSIHTQEIYNLLVSNPAYVMIYCDVDVHNGYVIFERSQLGATTSDRVPSFIGALE